MRGVMRFQYRRDVDVVVVTTLGVVLETAEDVHEWHGLYVDYLKRFARKVDMVVDLDGGFSFSPAIASLFGEKRAHFLTHYVNRSCRTNPDRKTSIFSQTSSIKHAIAEAHSYECGSVDEGIRYLVAHRQT